MSQSSIPMTLQDLQNDRTFRALKPLTLGLALIYAFFTVSHYLLLPENIAPPMMFIAGTTSIVAGMIYISVRRRPQLKHVSHRIAIFLTALGMLNSGVHLALEKAPHLSNNIAVVIIATGFFIFRPKYFYIAIGGSLVAWAGIVFSISTAEADWAPSFFLLAEAVLISIVAFVSQNIYLRELASAAEKEHNQRQTLQEVLNLALENEARFRVLSDASFEGVAVHNAGIIRDANRAFINTLGHPTNQIIGQHISQFLDEADQERIKEIIANPQSDPFVVKGITKGGHKIDLEMRAMSLKVDAEHVEVIVARDITQAKKDAELLYQQALIYANIKDSVILTDTNGKITDCNPATEHLFGYSKAELIGKTAVEMWHATNNERQVNEKIVAELREQQEWSGEIEYATKAGKHGVVEAVALPLIDDNGEWIATLGISHDVTERVESERALRISKEAAEEANRAKSAFLANTTHELRTPLNAIVGYTELILDSLDENSDERLVSDVQRIQNSGEHLQKIISGILDLAKVEAGRIKLFLQDFDFTYLVDEVVASVEPTIHKNNNQLKVHIDVDPPQINADELKLRQVLINLLSNAGKFTQDGIVELSITEPDDDHFSFSVKDTGIGMSQEAIETIFEPFTQVESDASRSFEGTGLGLAISSRFSEMLGGRITVESELGVGTSFTLILPKRAQIPERYKDLIES